MIRAFLSGLIFWALTLLFPSISISGFWTIAGVIVLGGILNIVYKVTIGLFLIPFRILTLGFLSLLINTGFVYLMSHWFNKFTIEPGHFWQVVLFTLIYTFSCRIIYYSGTSKN